MGSSMDCKLNPCCGNRLNCNPPEQYEQRIRSALVEPAPAVAVYRFLKAGEIIQRGDECPSDDTREWESANPILIGLAVPPWFRTIRRVVPAPAVAVPEGWQTIDTAPRDETRVDIWIDGMRVPDAWWGRPRHECGEAGRYCDSCPAYDGWCDDLGYVTGAEGWADDNEPSHWRNVPGSPLAAAPEPPATRSEAKSDRQIVDEVNDLARTMLSFKGYDAPEGHLFYGADHPRSRAAWAEAVIAYEKITGSEVHDALLCLDDEPTAIRSLAQEPRDDQ